MFEGFQSQVESKNKDPGDVKWMYRACVVFQRQWFYEGDTSGLRLQKQTDNYTEGKKPCKVSEVKGSEQFQGGNQQWPACTDCRGRETVRF